jgi:hypothetical protein
MLAHPRKAGFGFGTVQLSWHPQRVRIRFSAIIVYMALVVPDYFLGIRPRSGNWSFQGVQN